MKHLKILALAAMACAALMAFASTASATHLSTGSETLGVGSVIKAETKEATLEDSFGIFKNKCASTVEGQITNAGGTNVSVAGNITSLTWSSCTHPTSTLTNGSLSIAVSTSPNGTVSGSGTEVTTEVEGGGVCIYGSGEGITLGTFDGAATNTENAKLTLSANVKLLKVESGTCPENAKWTGTYTVTSPVGLKATK